MTLALMNSKEVLSEDLLWMIGQRMAANPRSLQKRIGPSELGDPCTRTLLRKLVAPDTLSDSSGWLAQVGTAVHAWLAEQFLLLGRGQFQDRFLVEQEVTVGQVGGVDITGHADLFDIDCSTVVDWKVVSAKRLAMFRAQGPGEQYRRQAHLYGRGFVNLGHHVHQVMLAFLPREQELNAAYFWAEPYSEGVALQTLSRASGLLDLVSSWGIEQVEALYPPCGVWYCRTCRSVPRTALR